MINTEVVLIIKCNKHEFQMVRNILTDRLAFGIGKLID